MEKVNIQGVPETMLQTLFARAAYSQQKNAKFQDSKAEEIVSRMDYDFSLAGKDAMMSTGVIARTILLDRMVGDFIRKDPNCTVVNIACGMDTRFYRLEQNAEVAEYMKRITWYNLDLPEAIAVRSRFFEEKGPVFQIAKSAMDQTWTSQVAQPKGAVLVVIEGLVMYLSEEDVKQILSIIGCRFDHAEIIMEIMNPWVAGHMKEKSIDATSAKFTWGVKSGKDLERLVSGLTWVRDVSLVEGMKVIMPVYRLIGCIPVIRNISNKLAVLRIG